MEENKSKKVSLGTVVLIILLILSIVIVGIALYKMNESNIKISELNKEISSIKNQNNVENKITNQISYSDFSANFEKELKELNSNDTEIIEREVFINTEDEGYRFGYLGAYIDKNNDAYIKLKKDSSLYNTYGEKYKVDSDILNLYNANYGNGGFSDIIFIRKDGTAYKVSTVNGEKITYEKIPNVKDAVTIIPYSETDKNSGTGAYSYLIIDVNGNVVSRGK